MIVTARVVLESITSHDRDFEFIHIHRGNLCYKVAPILLSNAWNISNCRHNINRSL